ncbi:MAG: questin oxidase family protein, partial [Ignavibacteria bacterium]|nr:questin oxidase family protein [Ignavibacteria bacterium]
MTNHDDRVIQMLDDKSFHIEFHGYLSNDAKHAVIALDGLGANAEDIAAYVEDYATTTYGFGLEPPKQSDIELTEANWRDFLGK